MRKGVKNLLMLQSLIVCEDERQERKKTAICVLIPQNKYKKILFQLPFQESVLVLFFQSQLVIYTTPN